MQVIDLLLKHKLTDRIYWDFFFADDRPHEAESVAFRVKNAQVITLLFNFEKYPTLTVFKLWFELYVFSLATE